MRSFSEEKIPKTGLRGERLHFGMRVDEALELTHKDVKGRKMIIKDPKSEKELEVIFNSPIRLADRLKAHVRGKGIEIAKGI